MKEGYLTIPDGSKEALKVNTTTALSVRSVLLAIAVFTGVSLVVTHFGMDGLRTLEYGNAVPPPDVIVYQSSLAGDRFLKLDLKLLHERNIPVTSMNFGNGYLHEGDNDLIDSGIGSIDLCLDEVYQEIIGFGGAFTEASAMNYQMLPPEVQQEIIKLYFSKSEGIGYSMGRIHINSCDFCVESYSFDDTAGDWGLENFDMSVTHDQQAIIPLIREAMSAASSGGGTGIRLVASPWSPPAWMKVAVTPHASNLGDEAVQSMLGSAKPDGLLADAQETWSKYISKFIKAYKMLGIPVWALTPQNEPEFAAPWEACVYSAEYEEGFISNYLGPTLRKDHPELLILAFDHNKDHLEHWADVIYGNETQESNSESYVDGLAFHWYNGANNRLLDGTYGYEALRATHDKYPNKILLATEGCSCPGILLDNWFRGERLGHDLIFDLNSWANGWLDWNLIVNSQGGPNHLNNYCDAPIIANVNFTGIIVQPQYYFMGHFSKYVPTTSRRVRSRVIGNFSNVLDNPNIQSGVQLGIFPCEHSSRQLWTILNGQVQLTVPAISDIQMPGAEAVSLCVAQGSPYLQLGSCAYDRSNGQMDWFDVALVDSSELPTLVKSVSRGSAVYNVKLKLNKSDIDMCVGIDPATDNGDAGGALLLLSRCSLSDLSQFWAIDVVAHTANKDTESKNHHAPVNIMPLLSHVGTAYHSFCLTAGWPFLTGIAFSTGSREAAVVVMNESPSLARYELSVSTPESKLSLGISSRSIQTILLAI